MIESTPESRLPEGFITIKDALAKGQPGKHLHKEYLNASLVTMLSLLNFDHNFVSARGCSVWNDQDVEYLDFLGGYGALNLGHNHPDVVSAVQSVSSLPNLLQISLGILTGALAKNLADVTPGALQRSFFGNSGAEAVEGALKLARMATKRQGLAYCHGSFHGKTLGALSVTGRLKYQIPFQPLLSDCYAVQFGDIASLEEVLKENSIAAFIVEPIQGEGGIIVPPDGYLSQVRKLCSKHGTLLIMDEIQTGLGRTGQLFACEYEQIEPDILCLAKSLGGGIMPISAFITTHEIWKKAYGSMEKAALHTSTFGGNTWAAAAGLAALEVTFRENLVLQAKEKGEYFLKGLKQLQQNYPLLKEVRGRGLMIGLEFNQPVGLARKALPGLNKLSQEYLGSLIAGELLNKYRIITAFTLNNPNVIRMEPPLTVTYEQLDRVLEALKEIFTRHKGFFSVAREGAKTIIKALRKK
ncbi:aminotransferase class-III [Desulfofarcimen acetoxidans DSM 771]|uniref:Aminotransferase class-III n=1 Tax=Desulfofarcimen acetoxidans (strain ATCC 49208 / DSM 771 / KCTC 5769 / VKM B-1644 / 5575) TaxID=485916 RepID=C8W596_DESAS|nr:aspartate aminotransferase family protein [Desulfofarcimen acetoxidans]ACV62078.1 aminotransferase class-III [Desulfofarcimen acetoxidans DSM 771]